MKNKLLEVQVKSDKLVIPAGKPAKRIVEIQLTAPPVLDDKPHIPLNLSLVIDRSGSMHGDKLHYVKEAAAHVIDLMREQDRLAVAVYDDQVQVLQHSLFLTDQVKADLKAKIKGIRSGASTFLYGGWLAGCREVAEAVTDDSFNRTLLLTDGLANVGVRDVDALSVHAQELFTRGISTSCFGVGSDYDEHLLESMANHGGGTFHFLETLNAIPLVFEREFEEIISVALKEVKITLDLPKDVEVAVSANWRTQKEGDQLTIFLGSLVADQSQPVYLQLSNLRGDSPEKLDIPIVVKGIDQDQQEYEVKTSISFVSVSTTEEAAQEPDQALLERFAVVDLADKANEALKRERAGDRAGSSRIMQQALSSHDNNIAGNVRERYMYLTTELSQGLDEAERKRRHYQAYQSKRGYQSIRDYRLVSDEGPIIADVEGQYVMINTGLKTSFGRKEEWFFLNELYRLPPSSDGVGCEQISSTFETKVDVVLGMDILGDLYIRIDPTRRVIQFSRQPFHSRGLRLALGSNRDTPTIQVGINGKDLDMRLMTGLRFCYVPSEALLISSNPHKAEDIMPGGQPFEVYVDTRMLELSGQSISLQVGTLTNVLRHQFGLAGDEGVLGADFLKQMPSTLSFPDGEMVLLV